MLDVVDLFREKDTRDEPGVGSPWDAFANILVPGHTIHAWTSRRLQVISNGRFQLQGRAAGLDLDVNDTWTEESMRPVQTLSSGEAIVASLALALGLANTLHRYTGGIRLDTIFVDEGFDSLCADAFDRAVETMLSLIGGGRLVGVNYPVDSLIQHINTRLEAIAGQHGSKAQFVIN